MRIIKEEITDIEDLNMCCNEPLVSDGTTFMLEIYREFFFLVLGFLYERQQHNLYLLCVRYTVLVSLV